MKNNWIKFFTRTLLFTLLFVGLKPMPLTIVYASHAVSNFDMKTANDPSVTAESLDAHFAKVRPNGPWIGMGKTIMALSDEFGINAAFFVGKMAHESGWGDGRSDYTETFNYGNLVGKGDAGSIFDGREWAKWSSKEMGMRAAMKLLDTYYKEGINNSGPLKTFQEALNFYAPSYENDHTSYMDTVQSVAAELGQDMTKGGAINLGSGVNSTGNSSEENKRVDNIVESLIEFQPRQYFVFNTKGATNDSSEFLTPQFVAGFTNFSKNIFEQSKVVMLIMSIAIMFYMALSLFALVLGYNGFFGDNHKYYEITQKLIGNDVEFNRQGILTLVKKMGFNIVIIAVVLSGSYIVLYSLIYGFMGLFL